MWQVKELRVASILWRYSILPCLIKLSVKRNSPKSCDVAVDTLVRTLDWANIGLLPKIGHWPLSVPCLDHEGEDMIMFRQHSESSAMTPALSFLNNSSQRISLVKFQENLVPWSKRKIKY